MPKARVSGFGFGFAELGFAELGYRVSMHIPTIYLLPEVAAIALPPSTQGRGSGGGSPLQRGVGRQPQQEKNLNCFIAVTPRVIELGDRLTVLVLPNSMCVKTMCVNGPTFFIYPLERC